MKKLLIICLLLLSACKSGNVVVTEDPNTLQNWKQAMLMRSQERYELAYHYYRIALSSATDENVIVQLKKEMEDMQRVIKSVR